MSQRLLAQPALAAHHSYIDKHAHLLEGKFLAIIMVGTDPSSQTYVRMKQRLGLKHNIDTRIIELSESTTQASDITNLIHELNDDITCAGIMLQLPLPAALREHTINICALIDPSKDVDGLGGSLLGLSTIGATDTRPATVGGILTLLDHYGHGDMTGKQVVVIGQSNLLGKAMAIAAINRGGTVFSANSSTPNHSLVSACQASDIIITCTGVVHLVGSEYVRNDQSQIIIDAGYGQHKGQPAGDVQFNEVAPQVCAITPIPGGVGPMTVAQLFVNMIDLQLIGNSLHSD